MSGETKIRVILADDHHLVRKGFRALLAPESDIEIVGEALDGLTALQLVERSHPDVLVIDLEMPGMTGMEAIRRLPKLRAAPRVLVLSMYKDTEHILAAITAGAAGYILKDAAVDDLLSGIRALAAGESFFSPAISQRIVIYLQTHVPSAEQQTPVEQLTLRERELFQLLAEGYSRQDIAARLHISPKTVDTHRANLLRKLAVESDADLVRLALKYGFISAG